MTPDDGPLPPPLPVWVRAAAGETAESYIRRLAHANHLRPSLLQVYVRNPGRSHRGDPPAAARRGQRQHPHLARLRPHRAHSRHRAAPAAAVTCGIPDGPQSPALWHHPRRRRLGHVHPADRRPAPRSPPHGPPGTRRIRRAAALQAGSPASTSHRPRPGCPGQTGRRAPHHLGDLGHRDRRARLRRLIRGNQGLHPKPPLAVQLGSPPHGNPAVRRDP